MSRFTGKKLSDLTAGLPNRWDMVRVQKEFQHLRKHCNDAPLNWNSNRYHLVDRLFLRSSELRPFYLAYEKAATKRMFNAFRGQCLNMTVIMILFYLETPQRYGYDPLIPIYKSFNSWRNLFIRKFVGLKKHGKYGTEPLKALPEITSNMHSFTYDLSKVYSLAYGMGDQFFDRAEKIQHHFRRQVLKGEHVDLLDLDETFESHNRLEMIDEEKKYNTKRYRDRLAREQKQA